MMETKLTNKQKAFVQEYMIDKNGTQAAIRAGYSKNTANEQAAQNLAKLSIKSEINKLQEKTQKKTEITAEFVIKELANIANADIRNFLDYRTEKSLQEYDDKGNPVFNYKQIIELMNSKDVDTRAISEVSISAKGVFTFKLHDKMKAIEMLAKHLGMFIERVEVKSQLEILGIQNDSDLVRAAQSIIDSAGETSSNSTCIESRSES